MGDLARELTEVKRDAFRRAAERAQELLSRDKEEARWAERIRLLEDRARDAVAILEGRRS